MNPKDFFCGGMFALCIDTISAFSPDEYSNGRDMLGDSSIALEIQRSANLMPDKPEDLKCHLFVTYDSILSVNTQGMVSLIV